MTCTVQGVRKCLGHLGQLTCFSQGSRGMGAATMLIDIPSINELLLKLRIRHVPLILFASVFIFPYFISQFKNKF